MSSETEGLVVYECSVRSCSIKAPDGRRIWAGHISCPRCGKEGKRIPVLPLDAPELREVLDSIDFALVNYPCPDLGETHALERIEAVEDRMRNARDALRAALPGKEEGDG